MGELPNVPNDIANQVYRVRQYQLCLAGNPKTMRQLRYSTTRQRTSYRAVEDGDHTNNDDGSFLELRNNVSPKVD